MSGKPIRVLVVEDDALVCWMIEDFLDDIGCEVSDTAASLEDALEKASTLTIDVAVLDVNLAGELSYPVAQVLLARQIPFLFATGYGSAGLPPNLQGIPILSKPFSLPQLVAALCQASVRLSGRSSVHRLSERDNL